LRYRADRKSRLAKLEGFRFFTLLRRVEIDDKEYEDDLENYISLTVWEDKKHFDEWRSGEAFKEAHGGGGIVDFVKLLSTALFILKGSPKPAFYDGLLPKKGTYKLDFATDEGWRQIPADGKNFLPTDIFVVQTRYEVDEKSREDFEKALTQADFNYDEADGFVGSFYQRRDATKADDRYNYIDTSIWKDKNSYNNYLAAAAVIKSVPKGLFEKKSPVYYEGKLALNSAYGI